MLLSYVKWAHNYMDTCFIIGCHLGLLWFIWSNAARQTIENLIQGLGEEVLLHTDNWQLVGHTKFACDWCFRLLKQSFRKFFVSSLYELATVVGTSIVRGLMLHSCVLCMMVQPLFQSMTGSPFCRLILKSFQTLRNIIIFNSSKQCQVF